VARLNAMIQLARIWAAQDPRRAAETFLTQASDSERARGVAQALSTWAKSHPAAARQWLSETVSDPTLSAMLRKQLYSAWAGSDPTGALADAMAMNSTGPELDGIFGTWAASDLEAAVKYQEEKLPANLQKQLYPVLLLSAAAQKSPLAETIFADYFASNPAPVDLLTMGKALSGTEPKFAGLIAEKLSPSLDADMLRQKIAAHFPGSSQVAAVGVIEDSQEAGIPAAKRGVLTEAGAELSNSVPR
jgi:hypothetical protein